MRRLGYITDIFQPGVSRKIIVKGGQGRLDRQCDRHGHVDSGNAEQHLALHCAWE